MVCTYDIFYDRWRSCTISYTFGTLPDRIGAYRYISAITSCDRLIIYKVKQYVLFDYSALMNTLEIDTLLKKHPHSRPVFKGVDARNRLPRLLNGPYGKYGSRSSNGTTLGRYIHRR